MVLTQEKDTSNYLASLEAAYRLTEVQLFNNIISTCYAWSSVPNSSSIPSGTKLYYTNPNDSVSKVDYTGSSGQTSGPSLLLKVMAGDSVNISVQSFYNTNTDTTTTSSFNNVLNSLVAGLMGTATGGAEGTIGTFTASTSPVYNGLNSFLRTDDPPPASGYPKAHLNWIFLDDQFNYVSSSSGSVAAASLTYPAATLNTVAPSSTLTMPRNGYFYVWVSNETQNWDVFFDNLKVQYKTGPVLEENDYYPFGLTMAGISDKAIKTNYSENKYRYNAGSELQNNEFSNGAGLQMYETNYRGLDPQLGRFSQIDPLADKYGFTSTYQFALNNPVMGNDPSGLKTVDPHRSYYSPGYQAYINQLADPLNHYNNNNNNGGDGGGGGGGSASYTFVPGSSTDLAQTLATAFQNALDDSDPNHDYNITNGVSDQGVAYVETAMNMENPDGSNSTSVNYVTTGLIQSYGGINIGSYTTSIQYSYITYADKVSEFETNEDGNLNFKANVTISSAGFISSPISEGDWQLNYSGLTPTSPTSSIKTQTGYNNVSYQVGQISLVGTFYLTQDIPELATTFAPYVIYNINFTIYSNDEQLIKNNVQILKTSGQYLNFIFP